MTILSPVQLLLGDSWIHIKLQTRKFSVDEIWLVPAATNIIVFM